MAAALKTDARAEPGTLLRALAAQDYFIGAYLLAVAFAVFHGTGPDPHSALPLVQLDLALYVAGLCLTRGGLLPRGGLANATLYRLLGPMIIFMSYFQLRTILPAVSSEALDLELYALDLRLFGVEPAVAWDRFVTTARTEWFSFFYFSYFIVLALYLSAMTFLGRHQQRLVSFALGVFLLFGLGQLLYMVVPGYGPYAALAHEFTRPLEGPTFWVLVDQTVATGGALKDIFPSLHTAVPTFFALFTFRHRHAGRAFRVLWPIVALVASQIVIATMYLRWHYLIDVIAGLALAAAVDAVSDRIGRWEVAKRARLHLPPVYDSLRG